MNTSISAYLAKLNSSPVVSPSSVCAARRRTLFFEFCVTNAGELLNLPRVEDHTITMTCPHREVAIRIYYPTIPSTSSLPSTTPSSSSTGAYLYLHGGGWHAGSLTTYENVCRRLCMSSQCIIASLDYRLAPEHVAPGAVLDAVDALSWLHASAAVLGIDASRIGMAGDSAGGNIITAATVALLRDGGVGLRAIVAAQEPSTAAAVLRMPKALFLIYPALDLTMSSGDSYSKFGDGFYLRSASIRHYIDIYLRGVDVVEDRGKSSESGNSSSASSSSSSVNSSTSSSGSSSPRKAPSTSFLEATDALVSPLLAADSELAGFPPTHIDSAAFDPLLSDSVVFAEKMTRLGVSNTHICRSEFIHAWMMHQQIPEVLAGIEDLGKSMRKLLIS